MNSSGVDNNNSQIGQSVSKCKQDILSILNRLKNFYDPCDLDTVRGFSETLKQSLNKVFKNFIENCEQSSNGLTITCRTIKNNANLGEIIPIENPSNDSGVLARTEVLVHCSTETKTKKRFVKILEDLRIKQSPDTTIMLKQFSHSPSNINSNKRSAKRKRRNRMPDSGEESFVAKDQNFGDHIEENHSSVDVHLQNDGEPSPKKFRNKFQKVKRRARLVKANDPCEICRKIFPNESFLIYHRRVHLAEYPIHCSTCFEVFFKFTEKDLHERNCHKLRYECYRCGKTMLCFETLKQHMQRH